MSHEDTQLALFLYILAPVWVSLPTHSLWGDRAHSPLGAPLDSTKWVLSRYVWNQ